MVRIRNHVKQSDPYPYQIEKQDPDQYHSKKQDPDPDQKGLDPQHCQEGCHLGWYLAVGCPLGNDRLRKIMKITTGPHTISSQV
jgi:hypothetical protein